ncbi:MAG: hypothetical protein ABIN94_21250 [Ferruginibacter sp.]
MVLAIGHIRWDACCVRCLPRLIVYENIWYKKYTFNPANGFHYLYGMIKVLYLLSIIFALTACNHGNPEIKERLANPDSVAINYFKGDGTMDTVVAVKIIRDKQKLEQLVQYIAASSSQRKADCGYDGSLHFFKMNSVIQDIDFRMNAEGCMLFSFMLYGKREATELPASAKELLNSFRK